MAILTMLVSGFVRAQSPPAQPAASQLREQLVESLRKDLETAKAQAGETSQKVASLASLTAKVTKDGLMPPERDDADVWYAQLLTVGSTKSIDLATAMLAQLVREREESRVRILKDADAAQQAMATKVLDAKTARDMEPFLTELADHLRKVQRLRVSSQTPEEASLVCGLDFARRWQKQLLEREAGNPTAALDLLETLSSEANAPRQLDKRLLMLKIAEARRAAGWKSEAEIIQLINEIAAKALVATTPQEFDELLLSATALQQSAGTQGQARRKFADLISFLKQFQNALLAVTNHDAKALNDIQNTFQAYSAVYQDGLSVPRSKLIARLHDFQQAVKNPTAQPVPVSPVETPDAVLARMTDLDSVSPNLPALRKAIESMDPPPAKWGIVPLLLESLAKNVATLRAGKGLSRAVHQNPLDPSVPQLVKLQAQYDLLCLNVGFAADSGITPDAADTPETYAVRVKDILIRMGKWELLRDLAVASVAVNPLSRLLSTQDSESLAAFLYASRLEIGGDFRSATMAYQFVLTSSSKLIPANTIGQHLQEIRENHPAEYRQGIDDALAQSRGETRVRPGDPGKELTWNIPARKPN